MKLRIEIEMHPTKSESLARCAERMLRSMYEQGTLYGPSGCRCGTVEVVDG